MHIMNQWERLRLPTWKNDVILIIYAMKNDGKYYSQIFWEALLVGWKISCIGTF